VDGKSGYIVVAVEIFAAREITTKNGQKMAFLVISDGTSAIENIICFPNQWVEMKAILYPGNTALIQLEKARGRQGYIIKQCFQI
jgi:DNA polymerase III alpha subunit